MVEAEHPGLCETYFVKGFVGGLKEEMGGFVSLLKPRKLTEAIATARVQEMIVEAISKRNKPISAFHRPAVSMMTAVSLQADWKRDQLALLACIFAVQAPQRNHDHHIPLKTGSDPFTS